MLEALNREILLSSHSEQDRGMIGVRDRGTIEYIEGKVSSKANDLRFVAWALYMVATAHPFFQGNKRTAFITAEVLLNKNNLGIHASAKEAEDFMLSLAMGRETFESATEWLRMRLEPRSDENLCQILERHKKLLNRLSEM